MSETEDQFTVAIEPRRAWRFLDMVWSQEPSATEDWLLNLTERELTALLVSMNTLAGMADTCGQRLLQLALVQGYLPVPRAIRSPRPGEVADTDMLDRLFRGLDGEGRDNA